jgi:dGTPase
MRMSRKAVQMIEDLFQVFMNDPRLLSPDYQIKKNIEPQMQARKIADYIAGMTDRYAIKEHGRIFGMGVEQ